MGSLHPTLWRTGKMLTGQKRIQLLRELHHNARRNVTQLGDAVGIKRSDASQELRRIQSRGLLSSKRNGVHLIYAMTPDPQVPSAAPILRAIQAALKAYPPKQDLEMCRIASGFSNVRRIAILQILLNSPGTFSEICKQTNIPGVSLVKHLKVLENIRFIRKTKDGIRLQAPRHPLAKALLKQIETIA